jgi:hypothetical protein
MRQAQDTADHFHARETDGIMKETPQIISPFCGQRF